VITRAVGVGPDLTLDLHRDGILADDRFLLCSDGLTRVISDADISVWMQERDIRHAVDGLIKTTLEAGAPDNVTVLVAEVHR
jgi:serine/threonine protein phosphatase PrpC